MALWTVDSTAVTTDSTTATVDGFNSLGTSLLASAQGVAGSTAFLSTSARLAAIGSAVAGASGVLINFASVTLTAPLFTGIGGILDPNIWVGLTPPVAGSVIFYDPTFVTIMPNGEITSTNPNCTVAVHFQSSSGLENAVLLLTSGFVAYANAISSANAALATSVAHLSASGAALVAASSSILTSIRFANATSAVSSAAAALSAQIQLSASASALSNSAARAVSSAALAAAAADLMSAVGVLSTQIQIVSSSASISSAGATITTNKPLTGSATSISSAIAALSTRPGLPATASASAIALASATLTTESTLSGLASSVSSAFADLTTQILMMGSAAAISSGQAVLVNAGSPIGLYAFDPEFVVTSRRIDGTTGTTILNEIGPTEGRVVTFDFAEDLDNGESLQGQIVVAVSVTAGIDPTPIDVLNGVPSYDAGLTQVMQPVSAANAVAGNDYYIVATAKTTNPKKVLARYALLPVRS